MQNKHNINTFNEGLDWDSDPTVQTPNSYKYALNMISNDLYQDSFISNEHSNFLFVDLEATITGYLYIQNRDSTLYFLTNGELWLVSHKDKSKKLVCSDKEFNCNWNLEGCEWIEAVYKSMNSNCNELLVYWSSGCEYRWINLDEMLSPKRKEALKSSIQSGENCKSNPDCKEGCGDRTCDYFKVFRGLRVPRITAHASESGGSQAYAGSYEFIARYVDESQNTTNWFYPTDPVNLESEHNLPTEISKGQIEVKFSNLDCTYHTLEIAVIRTANSQYKAQSFKKHYSSSNTSFIYYGQEGEDIDISEILEKRKKTFLKGRSLFQYAGRLFPYRLKQERNLDYQQRALNIKVSAVAYECTLEFAQKNNLKSFCFGESYAFGIGWNYLDYTKTNIFHIGNGSGGSNTSSATNQVPIGEGPNSDKKEDSFSQLESRSRNNEGGNGNDTQSTIPTYTYTPKKYNRTRNPQENNAGNTNTDQDYEDRLQSAISAINADINALCTSDNCRPCTTGLCAGNSTQIDAMLNDWEDMLSEFTEDKLNIKENISYTPSSIKQAADKIIQSIKQRERVDEEKATVTLSNTEVTPGTQNLEARGSSGNTYDSNGNLLVSEHLKFIKELPLGVKIEENSTYPFTKNCEGENIYGSAAGQNVKHFRFPSEAEINYFKSGSRGVPSKQTPDADEHKDITVILLGVKFTNIVQPTSEELSKELNKTNPYTIYSVERTDANKTVLAKGIAIRCYEASCKGKNYIYSRHAVNSFETVEKTIDIGSSRMIKNPSPHSSFLFFSPDVMFRKSSLPVTGIVDIGELSGIGYRHNLYAEGIQPSNQLHGTKKDQRGTCQGINLNVFTKGSGNYSNPIKCTGTVYAVHDKVIPSPSLDMSIYSLMNRYKESCLWVGGSLPALKKGKTGEADGSFVGDTLDHSAPIDNATANLVALVRNLPDQYGDVVNMAYIPILQSGNGFSSTIEGLAGDCYTNPISIKRTSYISDKVGNKFPIGGGSSTDGRQSNKKEDRSIKDNPEDVIKSYIGMWHCTKLPKTGDVADAKNWAGLHTTGTVDDWNTAKGKTSPDSDYYYPRMVKTLISFTCQSSIDTNKRVISDEFNEKFYPKLGKYYLGSHAPDNHNWELSFLNLGGFDVNQPSVWKLTAKILIRTIIGILMPMYQIHDLVNLEEVTDFGGFFVASPMLAAMWYLMNQVLFTNDWIDQMLGIPQCKTDDEGGEDDSNLHGLHDGFYEYNWSYSKANDYFIERGLPDPYYTCKCDNCLQGETTNEIYISNKQFLTSHIDSYKNFQALDYSNIPADSGKLMKLFSIRDKVYAHTEDNIYQLNSREIEPNSFQSGLYLDPLPFAENVPEGTYGLIDPKAAILTQYGYFWIDRQARKVYHFDQQITEISAFRMYNFFKDFLNFCSTSECRDEKISGISYSMGVDPRLNRLLLTKNDPSGSWTISYSFLKKKWISFHSYVPTAYNWDRDDLYSIKGSQVWIHKNNDEGEQGDSNPCTFHNYFGKDYPCYIDFVCQENVDNYLNSFELNSLIIDTQACDCNNNVLTTLSKKETFDQIGIWNSYQTAGLKNIILKDEENQHDKISQKLGIVRTTLKQNQFRLNEFYDCTIDSCKPLVQYSKCNPEYSLVNYDFSKERKSNNMLEDKFMKVRLILNRNNIKLYLKYVLTNIQKNVR